MPRLFIGIAIPERVDHYLDNVIQNSGSLMSESVKHITLRFIGHVNTQTALRIENRLSSVGGQQFELFVEGCELFKAKSSRPILVAMVKLSPALLALHQQVGDIVAEEGVQLDPRPYKPHITLVRFSSPEADLVAETIQRAQSIKIQISVSGFVLYEVDRSLPSPYFKRRQYDFTSLPKAEQSANE